eukprot:CAMPEP_0194039430 /NCGR_PEP_ID=MMETSP0009_2-20130614/11552_1 /TAXON_ID=210454 /ORGANISM="Grammatophora oceanica, Strain CCMP 410" /LENGTH=333 /DNA_ID=CAMNT_0038682257 /DNA_START=219 /DNA_END=1220 /DNA_ORIENTATION=-
MAENNQHDATVEHRVLSDGEEAPFASSDEFDPVVFWSVNAIWMTVLACLIIFFWKCNGSERLQRWMTHSGESDRIYARTMHRRREAQREARKMSPTQRKNFLERSFQRNKVHMIVEEGDVTRDEQSLDGSFRGKLDPSDDNVNTTNGDPNTSSNDAAVGAEDLVRDPANDVILDMSNNGALEQLDDSHKGDLDGISKGPDGYAAGVDIETGVALVGEGPPSSTGFDTGWLKLRSSSEEDSNEPARRVPNCCAVCLGPYEVGDSVVWSSNPCCSHAFHEDCVVDWFIKMQDGTPCPCCRSDFLPDIEKDIQETKTRRRIRWGAGNAMNVNAVRL